MLAAIAALLLVAAGPGPAFAATAATAAAVVLSIFFELYPRVVVSTLGAANDLTVRYTASASYALTVLTIVLAVLLPVGLAYPGWIYHVVRTGRCTIPTGTDAPPTSSADAANPVTDRARSPNRGPTTPRRCPDCARPTHPGSPGEH